MNATSVAASPTCKASESVPAAAPAVMARQELGAAIRDCIATSGAMKPPAFATVYESVLSRVPVGRLLEIGIHQGGSIRMWRQLLGTKVRIACLDIKPEACDAAVGVADHVYAGSQTDPHLLERIANEAGPFDIIIDDGSHQNPHMIFSFEALFEYVSPGGAYIIEDMFTSYWPRYRGGLRKSGSLIEYAKDIVDRIYTPFVSDKYKAHFLEESLPNLQHSRVSADIESIEFFAAGIIVVHKRPTGRRESPPLAVTELPCAKIRPTDCLLTGLKRHALLKLLPTGGVGVEIGVNRGAYSKKILEFAAPRKLHLIDPWPVDSSDEYIKTYSVRDDMQAHFEMVKAEFADRIERGEVVLHRKYSRDCSDSFADGQFDFVYVDGMHSYAACIEDLRLYGPKVRGTGLLMGHDFSNTEMGRRKRFGVVRAVSEFVAQSEFRPVLVTMEDAPTFVLTRDAATRERLIAAALDLAAGTLVPFERLIKMEQIAIQLSRRVAQVVRID